MISRITCVSIVALVIVACTANVADARKRHVRHAYHTRHATAQTYTARAYDGFWSISIVTQRGTCDRTYQFQVQIARGYVTFQGPASISGRVSSSGQVRVSVWAGDKHAYGSGKLSRGQGRGRWAGRSRTGHCSGYWTARRY
jgi:hypothetical protein